MTAPQRKQSTKSNKRIIQRIKASLKERKVNRIQRIKEVTIRCKRMKRISKKKRVWSLRKNCFKLAKRVKFKRKPRNFSSKKLK
jgi:quinolinate synthase